MALTVRRTDGDEVEVSYRGGFVVDLPGWVRGDSRSLVASALTLWLRRQARRDARQFASFHARRSDLRPTSVKVSDLEGAWGTCGPEGNVTINWLLIFAPRQVLEYVIVHELTHLRYRNHNSAFWGCVAAVMPEFARAKAWLDENQGSLSSAFLEADKADRFGSPN